jgi:hypothetical protein
MRIVISESYTTREPATMSYVFSTTSLKLIMTFPTAAIRRRRDAVDAGTELLATSRSDSLIKVSTVVTDN